VHDEEQTILIVIRGYKHKMIDTAMTQWFISTRKMTGGMYTLSKKQII
jgi:hypothetical protein